MQPVECAAINQRNFGAFRRPQVNHEADSVVVVMLQCLLLNVDIQPRCDALSQLRIPLGRQADELWGLGLNSRAERGAREPQDAC